MAETIKTLRGFFWVNQVNCKSLRCIRNRSFALQLSIVKVGNGATEWNESATISPQTDDMAKTMAHLRLSNCWLLAKMHLGKEIPADCRCFVVNIPQLAGIIRIIAITRRMLRNGSTGIRCVYATECLERNG